jgi:hypothetical protein
MISFLSSRVFDFSFFTKGRMSASVPTLPPTTADIAADHDADMPADNILPGWLLGGIKITALPKRWVEKSAFKIARFSPMAVSRKIRFLEAERR